MEYQQETGLLFSVATFYRKDPCLLPEQIGGSKDEPYVDSKVLGVLLICEGYLIIPLLIAVFRESCCYMPFIIAISLHLYQGYLTAKT